MYLYKLFLLGLFSITLLSNCSLSYNERDTFKILEHNVVKSKFTPFIIWSTSVGNGIGKFYSSLHPAYSNGVVYVADRSGVIKGINVNNGKEIWTINLAKKDGLFSQNSVLLSGGITIYNNCIYVGSEKAQIYALNTEDGSIVWQTTVAGEVLSSPTASQGLILIHTSNGYLQALNEKNGVIKWTVNLGVPIFSLRGESSPAISSGIVIVGGDNGLVSAVLIKDGQIIWQQRISQVAGRAGIDCLNDIDASPVIINNIVYASAYNGNFAALDLLDGKIIWKRNLGSVSNFTICGSNIYLSDQNNLVMAINIKDGTTVWVQSGLVCRLLTAPILYKKSVVLGDNKGYIYWLDHQNGNFLIWKKINNSGFLSEPIIADDKLLIQAKDGTLYAFVN